MNRFGICDLGFRIDEGNAIDVIPFDYELSAGTESALTRNTKHVTRYYVKQRKNNCCSNGGVGDPGGLHDVF